MEISSLYTCIYQINKTIIYEGPRMQIPNMEEVTPSLHRLQFPIYPPECRRDDKNIQIKQIKMETRETCTPSNIKLRAINGPNLQSIVRTIRCKSQLVVVTTGYCLQ